MKGLWLFLSGCTFAAAVFEIGDGEYVRATIFAVFSLCLMSLATSPRDTGEGA